MSFPSSPMEYEEDEEDGKEHGHEQQQDNEEDEPEIDYNDEDTNMNINNEDYSDNDDNDDNKSIQSSSSEEEDLDKIWNMVETKLRTPFSSLELCKTIDHLPSEHAQYKFLKAIQSTFPRMAKQIQLRFLVSLLGFSTSSPTVTNKDNTTTASAAVVIRSERIKAFICNFLSTLINKKPPEDNEAQEEQQPQQHNYDEWIQHLAGIIMNRLHPKETSSPDDKASDIKLKKTVEGICKQLYKYTDALANQEAEEEGVEEDEEGKEEAYYNKRIITREYMYEDRAAQYIPFRFTLLNSNKIKEIVPECDDTLHFDIRRSASILLQDGEIEKRKVDEETKLALANAEIIAISITSASAAGAGSSVQSNGNNKIVPSTSTTTADVPASSSSSSSLMPSKARPKPSGKGSMFYRPPNRNALAGRSRAGSSRVGGRMGGGGRQNALSGNRRAVQAYNPDQEDNTSSKYARAMNSSASKSGMMMMNNNDSDDSDDYNNTASNNNDFMNEHEQDRDDDMDHSFFSASATTTANDSTGGSMQSSKNARKRKMLAAAMANKLKNKKAATAAATAVAAAVNRRKIAASAAASAADAAADAAAAANAAANNYQQLNGNTHVKPTNSNSSNSNTPTHSFINNTTTPKINPSMQQQQLTMSDPSRQATNTESNNTTNTNQEEIMKQILSSNYNKVTPQDKIRIQKFFTTKENPTPESTVYKIKLNEERKVSPENGKEVKETLYLELDYKNMGFKKSKKTKKY